MVILYQPTLPLVQDFLAFDDQNYGCWKGFSRRVLVLLFVSTRARMRRTYQFGGAISRRNRVGIAHQRMRSSVVLSQSAVGVRSALNGGASTIKRGREWSGSWLGTELGVGLLFVRADVSAFTSITSLSELVGRSF